MSLRPSDQPGQLYLGGVFDSATNTLTESPVYYPSKDLVTHGICIGMTGSGKTGLCIALLEECAHSGIPAILIDPKGDLTNLKLLFPELNAEALRPWINEDEARRKNMQPEEFAAREAATWSKGLADWGLSAEHARQLQERVEVRIFTPGSTAATPLSVLRSFDPPSAPVLEDDELRREQAAGAASALLGLFAQTNTSVQSREHILLATILEQRWLAGEKTRLTDLIQLIQSPPFERLGAMALETFFPANDRLKLALDLNALLAAPTFQSWMEGEPLSIETLLRAPDGRPRLSICYIAHLGEAERMFFVSLLLNQTISWMRAQAGTSNLRALLYFDEIFGYIPPHPKDPPTKRLLMTILKQGRAYGLGTLLVTQNPVDLDYKAVSNCGTWLIGRLQTEQDKARILDGLQGAMDQAGNATSRSELDEILTRLGKRVFLLHNVHSGKPVVFHSRWAMSYLAGPMTREQLRRLTRDEVRPAAVEKPASEQGSGIAPSLPPGLVSRYAPGAIGVLEASLFATVEIFYKDTRAGDTRVETLTLRTSAQEPEWNGAEEVEVVEESPEDARYGTLPPIFQDMAGLKRLAAAAQDYVAKSRGLEIYECARLKLKSGLNESKEDFETRVREAMEKEIREGTLKLEEAYRKRRATLESRLEKERGELQRDEERLNVRKREQTVSVFSNVIEGIVSLLSGRKASGARKLGSSLRGATGKHGVTQRAALEVEKTEQNVELLEAQLAELQAAQELEMSKLELDIRGCAITDVRLLPTKTAIKLTAFGALWG